MFGGSGNGEQIAANKVKGIRAALVWSMDTAILAREHNDANVISIGARQHTVEEAIRFIDAFIAEPFSGDERHARRIAQLAEYETTGDIAGKGVDAARSERASEAACPRVTPSTASPASSSATSSATRCARLSPQGRFAGGAAELDGRTDDRRPRRRQADVPRASTTTSGCACTSACTARGTSPATS